MPFLDMVISLKSNQLKSSVFRKNTNTDVLLNYGATAPTQWKSGLIKCFLHRANIVCSDKTILQDEIDQLRDIFFKNGYPKPFFDKILKEYFDEAKTTKDEKDKQRSILKIPYLGKTSALFGKRMRKLINTEFNEDLQIVYQTDKVENYFSLKDSTPRSIMPKVVYQFTCPKDSGAAYVGYTNRTLGERVKEHLRGGTAVSDHISNCDTCKNTKINLEHFTILKRCRTKYETMIFEAIFIQRKNPKLNHQLVKPGVSYTLNVFS